MEGTFATPSKYHESNSSYCQIAINMCFLLGVVAAIQGVDT